MAPFAHHLTMRIVDDRIVCKTTAERRRVARSFLERAEEFRLLAFRAADTHLHALVAIDASAAAEFARRVEISIQHALGPGARFSPVHCTPIVDQRHLNNAFRYILGQEAHHGIATDPLHEASNLPDLLGLRLVGRHTVSHVRSWLPRVRREDLLAFLPERVDITPRSLDHGHLALLADAAAAAFALPDLGPRVPEAVAARAAAVAHGRCVSTPGVVAAVLGISLARERALARSPVPSALLDAVLGQLLLRRPALAPASAPSHVVG